MNKRIYQIISRDITFMQVINQYILEKIQKQLDGEIFALKMEKKLSTRS